MKTRHRSTNPRREPSPITRAAAVLIAVLLNGCSAHNPVSTTAPADVHCPDLTGSYCATGRMYEKGADRIESASLSMFLPAIEPDCYTDRRVCQADRVDFAGGEDGQLRITLYAEGEAVATRSLQGNEFSCGNNTLLLDNDGGLLGGMGPPAMPIVAMGWNDAHSLFWRSDDGGLRVRKLGKTTVAVMLAIPVSTDEESWARFRTTEQGCD
ncbi:MAG: hypothetical protein KDI33_08610 [Halioglobus sp.]|nr:hypothetical protein [Halioglobus sp.]